MPGRRPGRGGPAPGDRAGQPAGRRRALPAARRPARWTARRRRGPQPKPSSWRSGTAPGCGWPRQRPPARPGSGPRWPRRCSWPPCTACRRTGPGARPGRRGGRFAERDLAAILAHQAPAAEGEPARAGEQLLAGPGHQRVGTARRDGGSPMTLRAPHHDAVLTSEEIAVIRRALAACSQVLTWAGQHGDAEFREMLADLPGPKAAAASASCRMTSTCPSTTWTSRRCASMSSRPP